MGDLNFAYPDCSSVVGPRGGETSKKEGCKKSDDVGKKQAKAVTGLSQVCASNQGGLKRRGKRK